MKTYILILLTLLSLVSHAESYINLWNTHNFEYRDRGTETVDINILSGEKSVWSKKNVSLTWDKYDNLEQKVIIPNDLKFTKIRLNLKTTKVSAGLTEIKVVLNDKDVTQRALIATDGNYSKTPVSHLIDGIDWDDDKHGKGYWLHDKKEGWVELDFQAGKKAFTGKVVGVTDGDTIVVLDSNKKQHRIRLGEIDTPEKTQAFGTQAKQALSQKIYYKNVRVYFKEKDRYGRIIGTVGYLGRNINAEMVKEGFAWHYKRYSKSKVLDEFERTAKLNKLGLWKGKLAVAPWDFRHKSSEVRKASPPKQITKKTTPVIKRPVVKKIEKATKLTHWVTDSSGIRHNSSCQHFKNSKGRFTDKNGGERGCKKCGG
jgi:endonuclease YncB( thermonuclease family)